MLHLRRQTLNPAITPLTGDTCVTVDLLTSRWTRQTTETKQLCSRSIQGLFTPTGLRTDPPFPPRAFQDLFDFLKIEPHFNAKSTGTWNSCIPLDLKRIKKPVLIQQILSKKLKRPVVTLQTQACIHHIDNI